LIFEDYPSRMSHGRGSFGELWSLVMGVVGHHRDNHYRARLLPIEPQVINLRAIHCSMDINVFPRIRHSVRPLLTHAERKEVLG
jgi:hypothetical protein